MNIHEKLIMISITFLICLSGCEPITTDTTLNYKLPEGLADCKIYTMEGSGNHPILYVVRCPLSETSVSYRMGKLSYHTITVEMDTNGIGEYNRLKVKFDK